MRFLPSGQLDRGFGGDGIVRTLRGRHLTANAVTGARGGRILTTGAYVSKRSPEAQVSAMRYLPSGKPDPGFGHNGLFSRDLGLESVGYAATTLRNGKVVIGGRANRRKPEFPELESALDNADFLLIRFKP